jgi:ABC-type multidrug transport system ATPase subunit
MCEAASLHEVFFRYRPDQASILRGISLKVAPGDRVSITGPNGAGKSTIIRMFLGYLLPSSGVVRLCGAVPYRLDHYPDVALLGELSSEDEYGSLPNHLPANHLISAICEMYPKFGNLVTELELDAADIQRTRIGHLSKGQRQRLSAYLALVKRPKLILADEPLEGLDKRSRDLLERAIANHLDDHNAALVWISHRKDECLRLARTHYELRDGLLALCSHRVVNAEIRRPARDTEFRQGEFPEVLFAELAERVAKGELLDADIHIN